MSHRLRLFLCLSSLVVLLSVAGAAFWYQDWRYALPTSRPRQLTQIALGTRPNLPPAIAAHLTNSAMPDATRPILLHFFNPGCPCSRFNLDHVRDLQACYDKRVYFLAVIQGGDPTRLVSEFRALNLDMPFVTDIKGAIAGACGVYSTPQAVLLDRNGKLYYRGNYNTSRYCTSPATEYARIALASLLMGKPPPAFSSQATVAYGCPLPSNRETSSSKTIFDKTAF